MAEQNHLFPKPGLLSTEQLNQIRQCAEIRSKSAHATTLADWYRQDVPALLGHVAALELAARYIPVTVALPTKLTEAGWSEAVQVCTDGRVSIFPHNYVPAQKGKPGYWIQVGEPHQVNNVTHWREFADDPAPVYGSVPLDKLLSLAADHQPDQGSLIHIGTPGTGQSHYAMLVGPLGTGRPWTQVADALPPSLSGHRIERSAIVEIATESSKPGEAYYMPAIGGGWRNADTHTPVMGTVLRWRELLPDPSPSAAAAH